MLSSKTNEYIQLSILTQAQCDKLLFNLLYRKYMLEERQLRCTSSNMTL